MMFNFKQKAQKKDYGDFLFIVLDSLRYDAFVKANATNLKQINTTHKAYSYAPFTYASFAAMFVGFTPGDPQKKEKYINPKFGKIFRMGKKSFSKTTDYITLEGRNIVDGFNKRGYQTIGAAAMGWFDPKHATSAPLIQDFKKYKYTGSFNLDKQMKFVLAEVQKTKKRKFVFMNIGETHVPYYYKGAPWEKDSMVCIPFDNKNSSKKESEHRQVKCVEYIDTQLKPILELFKDENIIITSDHGDCWGEDGLWEHGIYHEKTFEVPLIYKLKH